MNPGDGPGSTPPPRLRMVRQPYLLDRLVLEPSVSSKDTLLCVYLSELGTAVAAFTLTAQESRSVRSWNEAVKKAQVGLANARASQVLSQCMFFSYIFIQIFLGKRLITIIWWDLFYFINCVVFAVEYIYYLNWTIYRNTNI